MNYTQRHEIILKVIQDHKPARGMKVTSGETCECGYWTGDEVAGVDRPPGVRDELDWHLTREIVYQILYNDAL